MTVTHLLWNALAIAGLVFGFGFVVFFHELGHFLAAKWCNIRVEQFAVGFGHAICSWRKGMGFTWGSSGRKLALLKERGEDVSRYSETEYRFNWMPLGGYVKMLGQDDLDPNAQSDDPRAFNRKSVGARMIVISAGVIMNVILAFLLFVVLFRGLGLRQPPAIVGEILTNSPAQKAGLRVGDRVLSLSGYQQHDFAKLGLWTALADPNAPSPIVVQRDHKELELSVQPIRSDRRMGMLDMGIGDHSIFMLQGPKVPRGEKFSVPAGYEATHVMPGEVVTAIGGKGVDAISGKGVDARDFLQYRVLDEAVQKSAGQPLTINVRSAAGTRTIHAPIYFEEFFGGPVNIAGLVPLPQIISLTDGSRLKGLAQPGDVVTALLVNGERAPHPTYREMLDRIRKAADANARLVFEVERDGKRMQLPAVVPNLVMKDMSGKKRGVGIAPDTSTSRPIIASVLSDSPFGRAKLSLSPDYDLLITTVGDKPVQTWFDVVEALRAGGDDTSLAVVRLDSSGTPMKDGEQTVSLQFTPQEHEALRNIRYAHMLGLQERTEERKTQSILTAAKWGVTETRDLLLQFYVTLQRLPQRSVDPSNFMGPVGIVYAGSLFAFRGADWLIWFLAMISANLAVVNFLPIPIVDGGHFVFLILEKIKGKPLSPKMQTVAQIVGLAIIVSVFLFVTYNDLKRFF